MMNIGGGRGGGGGGINHVTSLNACTISLSHAEDKVCS